MHAVDAFGSFLRIRLSKDYEEALALASGLSERLKQLWNTAGHITRIDLTTLMKAGKPKRQDLLGWAEDYLAIKDVETTPTRVAVESLISVTGNKDVSLVNREDVRAFVTHLSEKDNSTATIRRRLGSLSAVVNYAFSELEIDRRNPFGRVLIKGEGEDAKTWPTFTREELLSGYEEALQSGNPDVLPENVPDPG